MGFEGGAVGMEDNVRELCPGCSMDLLHVSSPSLSRFRSTGAFLADLSAVDERNNFDAPLFVSDPV
jgi:hypothetical protein